MGLAIIHTIVSIAILVPNLINALKIGDILSEVTPPSDNSGLPAEYPPKYFKVVMESIAFILLVAWRFWISVDSVCRPRKKILFLVCAYNLILDTANEFAYSLCVRFIRHIFIWF